MALVVRKEDPRRYEDTPWCRQFYGDLTRHNVTQLLQDKELRILSLEELLFFQGENGNNYEPLDFEPALKIKTLKQVKFGFGTVKKQKQFRNILKQYNNIIVPVEKSILKNPFK